MHRGSIEMRRAAARRARHLGWLCALAVPAVLAVGFSVTFKTTECNGDTGVGTAPVDRIYKIQSFDCDDGRKLKQVLVRNPRTGSFDVFNVTAAEAGRIQQGIDRYMGAREKAIERGPAVIIER